MNTGISEIPLAPMRIILLVNDSFFSYQIARPIIEAHADKIVLAVFSRYTTGSRQRVIRIARTASWRYLIYRTFVQLAPCLRYRASITVRRLVTKYQIPFVESTQINGARAHAEINESRANIAVAINFDQILHKKTLSLLQYGVLNAHASKLPADRGISPALWAFARGDPEVWVSLYKMDSGLDTGPIYEQFPVKVEDRDSAFSLYRKVCLQSGEHMARLLKDVIGCRPFLQANSGKVEKPHSWPDDQFSSLLQRNGRQLMKWRDFATILLN